ncbi:MAG: response regulator transcription factor [Steroidobacteraceae bacterium]
MRRILIIEDDPAIGKLLATQLLLSGIEVEVQRDGATGLRRAAAATWDLYIVDRMLPDMDGVALCRRLRANRIAAPVIFLTARDSELDRIAGLDAGADDYIGKPFSLAEVQARVRAQLRRGGGGGQDAAPDSSSEIVEVAGLCVDPLLRQVRYGGTRISLTEREFQLLHHLIQHRKRAWTREQLLHRIWGPGYEGYAHTVNSHINRLRAKLEPDPAHPQFILTVRGRGYCFGGEQAG